MKTLVVDLQAEQEIDEAVSWYESRSQGLGWRFLEVLEHTLQLVAGKPAAFARLRIGPDRLVIRKALLHRFPHTVVFLELEDELRVLAVAHQKRRPGYWLDRIV